MRLARPCCCGQQRQERRNLNPLLHRTLDGLSVPMIRTVVSGTRCAVPVCIGCRPRVGARPRRTSGQSGSSRCTAVTHMALGNPCCAVPICCSMRALCANWWHSLSRRWTAHWRLSLSYRAAPAFRRVSSECRPHSRH